MRVLRFFGRPGECAVLADTQNTGIALFLSATILSHLLVKQMVLADGVDWIYTQSAWHFPEVVKILHWPHGWRKRHAGAASSSKPGPASYEILKPLLWQGIALLLADQGGGIGETAREAYWFEV
jgi:hypothetical protein